MIGATYALVEEKYTQPKGERISYGIAVYLCAEQGANRVLIDHIHDITPNKEKLENLVNDCNRLGLSTVHIYDVVEDFFVK